MLVRIALTTLLALGTWGNVPSPHVAATPVEDDGAQPSQCGDPDQGPSFDDPSVDTDPDRPILAPAASSDDQGDPRDDDADGMCRSETLELWFPHEGAAFVEARLTTLGKNS